MHSSRSSIEVPQFCPATITFLLSSSGRFAKTFERNPEISGSSSKSVRAVCALYINGNSGDQRKQTHEGSARQSGKDAGQSNASAELKYVSTFHIDLFRGDEVRQSHSCSP